MLPLVSDFEQGARYVRHHAHRLIERLIPLDQPLLPDGFFVQSSLETIPNPSSIAK
jgi:hypothetical protein